MHATRSNPAETTSGPGLLIHWVLGANAGLLLAVFAANLIVLGNLPLPPLALAALEGAAFGACLGAVQWLTLRHCLSRPVWWIVASVAGFGVGFVAWAAAGDALGILAAPGEATSPASLAWAVALAMVAVGIPVGVAQGFALGAGPAAAARWAAAYALAVGASLAVLAAGQFGLRIEIGGAGFAGVALWWAVGSTFGLLTGLPLLRLIQTSAFDARPSV
jgi:hypothetical protein